MGVMSIRRALMQTLIQYADDLLTLAGLGVIVWASYLLHPIAGLYALGLSLVLVGMAVGKAAGGR